MPLFTSEREIHTAGVFAVRRSPKDFWVLVVILLRLVINAAQHMQIKLLLYQKVPIFSSEEKA